MSFMPAEEDDDFDFEDGFIDCGGSKEFSDSYAISRSSDFNGQNSGKTDRSIFSSPKQTRDKNGNPNGGGFSSFPQGQFKWRGSSNIMTPEELRMGIMRNNADVLKKYHNLGLPLDEPLRSGWTALMYAAHYVLPDIVKLLLQCGADVNSQCDMFTPLMCACSATSADETGVSECVRVLIDAGADVNAQDRYHLTPLILASKEGHLAVVKSLIACGAQINAQNSQGWTALTLAIQRSRTPIVVELLEAGADVNIQHADKLTVKDLAAHLPSDDMLALLERRPVNCTKQPVKQQRTNLDSLSLSSNNCTLDSGDNQARLTDLRYGELEVFLLGLDLAHLVGLFQEQLIDLRLLMTLTEQDLINAGVTQLGARKKILDSVQAVHKKGWQPSSLVSIHYNKRISCADAVAMLANSSRHLHYICSTVVYVKEQLRKHPDTILIPTDRVSPSQFLRHTEDTMKNLQSLTVQLQQLKASLEKRTSGEYLEPPDLIQKTEHDFRSSSSKSRKGLVGGGVALLACLAMGVAWWGREKLGSLSTKLSVE